MSQGTNEPRGEKARGERARRANKSGAKQQKGEKAIIRFEVIFVKKL